LYAFLICPMRTTWLDTTANEVCKILYVSILRVIIYTIWLFTWPSTHVFQFLKFKVPLFMATCFGINIRSSGHFQMFANN
jgi:hypothetical protein